MANTISNMDDIIDSRDVIARIEELKDERDALIEARESVTTEDSPEEYNEAVQALADWNASDEAVELVGLQALADECHDYCEDWKHGTALIRDSYFKTYAQELADDIGAIPKDAGWPCTCIDWEQATRELQMDYTSVSFDGVDYWVR